MHLVNDIPLQNADGTYNVVVEIPAGTNDKWTTDADSGLLYHEQVEGRPRVIRFLSYPFNYGFFPQTVLSKAQGGDGDPLDALILAPALPRGGVIPVRVLGGLLLEERGEIDSKLITLPQDSILGDIPDIEALQSTYPGMLDMLRLWFDSYKGPGAFTFKGILSRAQACDEIATYNQGWEGASAP